jgi:hypothetical protein
MTRNLLIVTAAIEAATGAAMIVAPAALASLLLGAALDSSGAMTVARVAGVALLSLGVACWLVRDEGRARGGRAVITAMLLYNVAVAAWCGAALRPAPR